MKNRMILEICSDSIDAALTAQEAGAQRIELCADLPRGGTTPSYGTIKKVREDSGLLDVFVLIRPRPGDFTYTPREFEIMREDIRLCGELGCDGIVTGILHRDGTVDVERSGELARLAHSLSMKATFHRAFDCCRDLTDALEKVIEAGYDRILTSGGYPTATEGAENLRRLVNRADGRIVIMPGSGVSESNIKMLAEQTGAREFHGSFRSALMCPETDPMLEAITGNAPVMKADPDKIRKAINQLNTI